MPSFRRTSVAPNQSQVTGRPPDQTSLTAPPPPLTQQANDGGLLTNPNIAAITSPVTPPLSPLRNQNQNDNDQGLPLRPPFPVPMLNAVSAISSEGERLSERGYVQEERGLTLWDQAVASLREKKSKQLSMLEVNLRDLHSRDSLPEDIADIINERHDKIRGRDGVSQSRTRKALRRTAKFVLSTKDLVMGVARLDHNNIAPIVLGGVFSLVQLIEGATEEALIAIKVTIDIAEMVGLWACLEASQIRQKQLSSLESLYKKLSQAILKMYEVIIVLLGTLMAYFDSKWRQLLAIFAPNRTEWEKLKEDLKACETNCNNIKGQIMIEKDNQDKSAATLKMISSHDIRRSYRRIQERTKIETAYYDRCQWIVDKEEFELWYIMHRSSVLWLRGTIGTGKTTLMARVIREMKKKSSMVEIDADSLGIFFFEKARKSSEESLSVENCLRSLVRQLSWNYASSSVEPTVQDKYTEFHDQQSADSYLQPGECIDLLKTLIGGKRAYIMIDAIDECKEPEELLEKLKELMLLLNDGPINERGALHLMLCSRDDLPVSNYFGDCFDIIVTSSTTLEDQHFYIDTAIDLKRQAHGLFRWVEIQIDLSTKGRFRDEREIENTLDQIEKRTSLPELNAEYARLLERLGEDNRQRALKMLRLLVCSFWPLSADSLAEALTNNEYQNGYQKVTTDDVRGILVGFISEYQVSQNYEANSKSPHFHGKHVIEPAHSSVIEFLMENSATADGFTELAQHTEAAELCFDSILHRERLDSQLNSPSALVSHERDYDIYRNGFSDLFYYSCNHWPEHCYLVFTQDATSPLVERTKTFILDSPYLTWNNAVRGLRNRELRFSQFPSLTKLDHVWHGDQRAKPGFVIVAYNLKALLEFPEVRQTMDLSDFNGKHKQLFDIIIQISHRTTAARLLQLYPAPVPDNAQWNHSSKLLPLAIRARSLPTLDRFLDSGQGSRQFKKAVTRGLKHALSDFDEEDDPEQSEVLSRMIHKLIAKEPKLWNLDHRGRGIIHGALRQSAQKILIAHARDLEAKGERGSVQRLLRMRDGRDRTVLDTAVQSTKAYLMSQLAEAVSRDGGVLYEVDR